MSEGESGAEVSAGQSVTGKDGLGWRKRAERCARRVDKVLGTVAKATIKRDGAWGRQIGTESARTKAQLKGVRQELRTRMTPEQRKASDQREFAEITRGLLKDIRKTPVL